MEETLILYEGKYGSSQKTAKILHEIISDSRCFPASDAPEELKGIQNLILVFGFLAYDTAKILKGYLKKHQEELREKAIGVIGVGLTNQALPAFLKIIEEPLGRKADQSWFVMGGYKVTDLTSEDRGMLEAFWKKKGEQLTDRLCFREDEVKAVGEELLNKFLKV